MVNPHLERRLLDRSGAVHARDPGLRRARLLLPAQPAAIRHADTEAADSASLEGGNLASDINYSALLTAQQGVYNEAQMDTVDYTCRLRYFDKVGDKYAVKPSLKSLVQFDFHNLKTEYLPQRNDAIFCRNVMIYFDEAEQKRLIEKFHHCLNPEGYLFVGHAESLFGLTTRFHMIHQNNATVYQQDRGAAVSFPSDEQAAELRELFFESAEEILQGMNEAGLALEAQPGDAEQLRHVRRAVHTLKGDSAACGYRQLSELAHDFEDVLTPELVRDTCRPDR